MYYFGPWFDPAAAEAKWDANKASLLGGLGWAEEQRPQQSSEDTTVKLAFDAFLTSKQMARDLGKIAPRTFDRYFGTCLFWANELGRTTRVANLGAGAVWETRRDDGQAMGTRCAGQ